MSQKKKFQKQSKLTKWNRNAERNQRKRNSLTETNRERKTRKRIRNAERNRREKMIIERERKKKQEKEINRTGKTCNR